MAGRAKTPSWRHVGHVEHRRVIGQVRISRVLEHIPGTRKDAVQEPASNYLMSALLPSFTHLSLELLLVPALSGSGAGRVALDGPKRRVLNDG